MVRHQRLGVGIENEAAHRTLSACEPLYQAEQDVGAGLQILWIGMFAHIMT